LTKISSFLPKRSSQIKLAFWGYRRSKSFKGCWHSTYTHTYAYNYANQF